jgi:hypothetical protein
VLTKAVLTPQVRLEDRASGLSSSARIRRPRGSVRPSPNATSALLANRVSQGPRAKATIAYLTSITGCPLKDRDKFIDAAAVLRHSIHQSSIRSPASGSRYDYVTYAIVHTNASACQPALERVGYTVLVRDNPVELYEVRNEGYRERLANPNAGCCQEKEFLKLYAYTMHGYQVVVHLDMDFLVLKPMDILFDSFWEPDEAEKWVPHAMWPEHQRWKGRIETMFTRDYPMSKPNRAAEKVGMQGGFWIVRPNQTAYDELVEHIREGNFQSGWFDGKTKYPGFYGAAMIQGLIAFYYGHYHPGQAIELDRCTHNQMVDPPRSEKGGGGCFVPVPEDQCRDCRLGNVTDVYSAHFTFCIKPVRSCGNSPCYRRKLQCAGSLTPCFLVKNRRLGSGSVPHPSPSHPRPTNVAAVSVSTCTKLGIASVTIWKFPWSRPNPLRWAIAAMVTVPRRTSTRRWIGAPGWNYE